MQNSFDPRDVAQPTCPAVSTDEAALVPAHQPEQTGDGRAAAKSHDVVRVELPGVSFSTAHRRHLTKCILDGLKPDAASGLMVGYINPHVYVLATNPHDTTQAGVDAVQVTRFLSQADFISIDGTGVQVGILLRQRRWLQRTVAEHLFNDVLANISHPVRAVLIGAGAGIADRAAAAMIECNPQIDIVATQDGYTTEADYRELLRKHTGVELVLIGAGTPRSERIAVDARAISPRSVIFHIGGGTLNTWAGTKQRAPRWLSFCGCEWLHRMIFEPHTRSRYTTGGRIFLRRFFSKNLPLKNPQGHRNTRASAAPSNPDTRQHP